MYRFYNYLNIFSTPLLCIYCLGKGPLWALLSFILAFVIHPLMDFFLNHNFRKQLLDLYGGEDSRFKYQIPLLLAVPVQLLMVVWAFTYGTFSLTESILAGTLCGLSGGILGIGCAHEMIHRRKKWERYYGQLMLLTINYPHFYVEHLLHHRNVGTKKDSDTAFKDESIYRFLLRSIPQGWKECWNSENKKTAKYSKSIFSLKNKMLIATGLQVLISLTILVLLGTNAFVVYTMQGIVTIVLLKWINYVEHYGLVRRKKRGQLEPIGLHHSWDSTSALTNFSLFNLGFHSYHHVNSNVEYHQLPKQQEQWNELPLGYSGMMMLALIPSKWKSLMNQKIEELEREIDA